MRAALPAILAILIGPALAGAQAPPPMFFTEPAAGTPTNVAALSVETIAPQPAEVFLTAPAAVAPAAVEPYAALPPTPTLVDPSDDDTQPPHDHSGHGHSHGGRNHGAHSHDDPYGFRAAGGFNDHSGHSHADHGHAGHNHPTFDKILPFENHNRGNFEPHGHAGHTSVKGYPFVHGIRTEIDFVERALEWDLVRSNGVDDGAAGELEFESELVWAFNSRMIFIFGTPLVSVDPLVGSHTAGVGDLELGFQFLAYGGERALLFTALNVGVPTGDVDRDLGSGNVTLEPTVLWLYDFHEGTYIQTRFGWTTPVSVTDVGSEFSYDLALFHTFLATKSWSVFRFFTPIVELNGLTQLNEDGYGRTVVDVTGGFRWVVRGADEIGIGVSHPISGATEFDDQVILSYRLHF
jgi:hypothetical protein